MTNTLRAILISLSLALLLSACGGGGGTDQPPSISTQPANITMVAGNNTTFSVIASGASLSYKWQVDIGSGFTNISDTGVYSGSTTATLTLVNVVVGMTGYKYRAVVNGIIAPSATSNSATLTVVAPTKAILKVSTANIPSGTRVGAVQISIVLPAGVTPSVLSGNDATGSVAASGNAVSGLFAASSYDAATRILTPGTISGTGFVSGEFLTITCSIAAGVTVTAADFPSQAAGTSVFDLNNLTNSIPGATCPISVTFQ